MKVAVRIADDWRALAESSNMPLAIAAAEDQNFACRHGSGFAAIEKAQAHNARMADAWRNAARQAA